MPMTSTQGGTAIENTLKAQLAQFAEKRASRTELSQDDTFEVNADLVTKLKAALLTALTSAWS